MKTNYIKAGLLTIAVAVGVTLNSCKKEVETPKTPGINLTYIDSIVKPNEDFFKYVNGGWLENAEIPSDRTRWGSFDELAKKTNSDALAILKEAIAKGESTLKDAANVKTMTDQQKAVNLFESIMDTITRDKQGIDPLKPYLAKVDAIKNIDDLQKLLIEMEPYGGIGFFGAGVGSHPKNSNINAGYLSVGTLGVSRDYYVDMDDDTKAKREKYLTHVARMMQYIGDSEAEAKANADKILAFETRMAAPRMTKEDSRDARKRFNPKSMADLNEMTPSIDWRAYFDGIGAKSLDTVIVSDPGYFVALEGILKENNIDDWKNYLRWSVIDVNASYLSTDIDKTNWEFYSRDLRGAKAMRDREKRALSTLNGNIGEALGKLYVDAKFPPEAKAKAEKMIKNVMLAFESRIKNIDWMTPETKEKAIEKLRKMKVKIAYPDVWKDYSTLGSTSVKNGGSYFDNTLHLKKWSHNKAIAKLGKEVDKSEWLMAPQQVNAYFMPPYNEIVFPAAILQPPFYNYQADDAVNYGGIGGVIGHEISHCFDDSGSRYDGDGNLNNWWTEEDLTKFTALGTQLSNQFNAVETLPDVKLNGTYTLGEDIGDLGGVNAAYDGLQMALKESGQTELIDGFTPEQRFFMSWATIWRVKYTDDRLKNQIKTDTHSPGMYRAGMPLQNIDAFYEAFDVKEGDAMYLKPEDRVRIW
jgi:predicted metalloendopeptidase